MTDNVKLGAGNITLKLGDDTYTLKPTIAAFQSLSKAHGGLAQVLQKCAMLDIDAIMDVVMAGLGPQFAGPKRRAEFSDKVFAAGVSDQTGGVTATCGEFVICLMNGGRKPSNNTEDLADEAQEQGNR